MAAPAAPPPAAPRFPFSALVGQDDLREALVVNAAAPEVGGVLVRGERGTAKSTAVRALEALLPAVEVVVGCPYGSAPEEADRCPCRACAAHARGDGEGAERRPAPLVELPVGATVDRVTGTLDLERALRDGESAFEPGLLARAHRGILYVDEVNLLADHLVDVLLDAAAQGEAVVEREGVSVRHPARFLLVGTMNPEEGELRPQLLDRFGLAVDVAGAREPAVRAEVVRRRLAFEADPAAFASAWRAHEDEVGREIAAARERLPGVRLEARELALITGACARLHVDGMRADLVAARAARALAARAGRDAVDDADVRRALELALPHRRRRGPLDPPGLEPGELDRALAEAVDDDPPDGPPDGQDDGQDDGPDGGEDDRQGPEGTGRPGNGDAASDPGRARHGDAGAGDAEPPPRGPADADDRGPGGGDAPPDEDPGGPPARGLDASGAGPPPAPGGAARPPAATPHGAADAPDADRPFDPAAPAPAARVERAPGTRRLVALPDLAGRGQGTAGRRGRAAGVGPPVDARSRQPDDDGDLALVATLRAAATRRRSARNGAGGSPASLHVAPEDHRTAIRAGREGTLVVFCVDASGSMGARRRMRAVKDAALGLLLDAYQRRDRIALVTFRGTGARVVLPPTASVERAAERLRALPAGGPTPLAAGLEETARLVRAARRRDPGRRVQCLVVTDGRASGGTAGLAAAERAATALGREADGIVVYDSEQGRVRLGLSARIATAAGARVLPLGALVGEEDEGDAPWAGRSRRARDVAA